MADTIRVVARIRAKPDRVEDMRELLIGLIEPTRQEGGCVSYHLLQNRDDPTDFTFVEEWRGDDAFDAHLASAHLQAALGELPDLAAENPDIRRYDVVG